MDDKRVAILIPCYNEEATVTKVVEDFRRVAPNADIYVYDNASDDATSTLAREAGALVRYEKRRGKGNVVAAMFREINADYYVMVDGDDTYPADNLEDLLEPLREQKADMVVGARLSQSSEAAFRPLHVFGNRLVAWCVRVIFPGRAISDVMSGYRSMTRALVKQVPVGSAGFAVETELTLQALFRGFVIKETPVPYSDRPEGSVSKLRTFPDGARVLLKIVDMFKAFRPLLFFGLLGLLVSGVGFALGSVPIVEFAQTGRVDRFPTAILAASLEIVAIVLIACGVVLDSFNHRLREHAQVVIKLVGDPGGPVD